MNPAWMNPAWKYVDLKRVLVLDEGWHYVDDAAIRKLATSLQRHGQLQPLVVRGDPKDDTLCTLVEGHKLLGAMLALGWTQAMAVHLGAADPAAATRVMLALEIRHEVSYAELADRVHALVEAGATAADVAAGSPFDQERIQHFLTLRTFDWTQLGQDDGQAKLDWDALATEAAEPPPEAAAALEDVTEPLDEGPLKSGRPEATPPAAAPAAAAPPPLTPAEPAPKTASAPPAPPVAASRAKPQKAAKVPKPPDSQMGLF